MRTQIVLSSTLAPLLLSIFSCTGAETSLNGPIKDPFDLSSLAIRPEAGHLGIGEHVSLSATVLDAKGEATTPPSTNWTSSNTTIANVSESGVVTGVKEGAVTITGVTGSLRASAFFSVITGSGAQDPIDTIVVDPLSATVAVGRTAQLTASPKSASGVTLPGRPVSWSSSNTSLATVSSAGVVTGVAQGQVGITARSEGKLTVASVAITPISVASIAVTPSSRSVSVGQQVQLSATVRDANGNVLSGRPVTWHSNSANIAGVTNAGVVTGYAAGSATIFATSEGRSGTAAITVTASTAPVASVTVAPATTSLSLGETDQLTATPRDASGNALIGRSVTWSSTNAGVASVSSSGLLTALAAGSTTIRATSEGKIGSASVTVSAAAPPAPGWPNQPAGFTQLDDASWGAMVPNGWTNNNYQGNTSIVSDASAPVSPSSVLQMRFPAGFTGLGDAPGKAWRYVSGREVYIGFAWKASANFQQHPSAMTKIAYLVQCGGCYVGGGRLAFIPVMYGGASGPYSLVVISEYRTNNDATNFYPNRGTVPLIPGNWHKIELYAKASTSAGARNGVLRFWVNGTLVGEYTGLDIPAQDFQQFELTPVWGGTHPSMTVQQTGYFWYDHVYISKR